MRAKKRSALLLAAATLIAGLCAIARHSGPVLYLALSLIANCLQEISR